MPIESFEEKEVIIEINTDSQTSITTQKLIGFLDCIIVDSNKKIQLIIESSLGYPLLHRPELEGVHYLVPRARTTTVIEDLKDFPDFEKFNLNEKLIITVIGPKETKVNLILRFC